MFKYSKRLMASIRFWCQEFKLRSKENDELDRISDITFQEGYGGHNSMAGFGIYMTNKRNRAERKRLHKEQLAEIK
jgi:nanoRNase/pAp phosphatase (c-di-AMP/oligoRNAs hydrolase)